MTRTPLGWLQLSHNKGRLALAMAGVGFATLLVFMQLGFMGALFESSVRMHRGLKADLVLTSSVSRQFEALGSLPRRRLLQALEVEGVADGAALHYGSIDWIHPTTQKRARFGVFGVEAESDVFVDPEISSQLWRLKAPNSVLFDREARGDWSEALRRLDAGEALSVELSGRRASVEGTFRFGATFGVDGMMIASASTWLAFAPARPAGVISLALLTVTPGSDPSQVRDALRARLPSDDTKVMTYEEFIENDLRFLREDSPVSTIFTFGVVIGLLVGAAIVYQLLATDVADHLVEYATFKAMGFSHRYLLSVVMEQAAILTLLGFLPGLACALLLYQALGALTALPIAMPAERLLIVFALTFLTCCLSGALATRRLAAVDPADVF
ncbi:MAG: ABC transporter permease DevC [Elsteraceae bacterium]